MVKKITFDGSREITYGSARAGRRPKILQFKIWLKGISPVIWRRVQSPASTTLRELHRIFQVAMGWEGVHLFLFNLRTANFGSWELGGRSPDISLGELQLRKGARFIYEYDLNIPWEHEVRLEAELPSKPRAYPHCVEGHASSPPEDCRGIADFLVRHDAWVSEEGLEDLAAVADLSIRLCCGSAVIFSRTTP